MSEFLCNLNLSDGIAGALNLFPQKKRGSEELFLIITILLCSTLQTIA